jgi:uncharacterized protein (TIGR00369 family)
MQTQGQELPEALLPPSPLAEYAGLRLIASDAGRAMVVLPVSDAVLTDSGGIDNGVITVLIEAAGAAAAASDAPHGEALGETVELFVSFARSAPEHPLTAEAHVVRRERHLRLCEVEVRDWNGDFVARGSLTQRA